MVDHDLGTESERSDEAVGAGGIVGEQADEGDVGEGARPATDGATEPRTSLLEDPI